MTKNFSIFFLCILITLVLSGCKAKTEGNSLFAFTERLNATGEYDIAYDGYIKNEDKKSFTKFFQFDEIEIMLQFEYNDKNLLTCLHIVFDNLCENHTEELSFIENSIYAFVNNDSEAADVLEKTTYPNILFKKDLSTKTEKIGNTEISVDVTDIGTVITVVKSNL